MMYLVVRKAVLQEDEGHEHFVAVYRSEGAARLWINSQIGEYFSPRDYRIAFVPVGD